MEPTKKMARIAGGIYLLVVISGILNLIYLPSLLIDWDNAEATVSNIRTNELLYRGNILAGLIMNLSFLALSLILYQLLKSVNRVYALLMVLLVLVSIPVTFYNLVNKLDVLTLIGDADYLKGWTGEQLQSHVMLALESYDNGILIAQIFWGLWLFPFGYLVYKSGFLPKFLGIMLIIGCFGYLIEFSGYFFFEGYGKTTFSSIAAILFSIGELGICLWLLIFGIKEPKVVS